MTRLKFILFTLLAVCFLIACRKQTAIQTAEDKIAGKTWFLEKLVSQTYINDYRQLPTFTFKVEKNGKQYYDSDGINGSYSIKENGSSVCLNVLVVGRQIDTLFIAQLGRDHLVMECYKNAELQVLYFSTRP